MSLPQTPTRVEIENLASKTSALESALKTVTKRIIVDEIAEEDDQTYLLSETESSEESDDSFEAESDISLDLESEFLAEHLTKNVDLVDDACIALKVSVNETDPSDRKKQNLVLAFMLRHEIPRKAFHSSIGLVTIYLYTCGFLQYQIARPLWAIFSGTSLFELVRLKSSRVNNAILPWVEYLIRALERDSCNGIVFYLAGVSLVLSFAPKDVAVVSILLLSWADTAASTVGRAWGKYTPKVAQGKSLAGCLASFLVGVLVCYFYYGYLVPKYQVDSVGDNYYSESSSHLSFPFYAFATGLVTSFSEAVNVAGLDDNFTIPVISSVVLSGLIYANHT